MAGSSRYTTGEKRERSTFLSGTNAGNPWTWKTHRIQRRSRDASRSAPNFLTDIVYLRGRCGCSPVTISETGWNGKIVTEPGTGTIGDVTVTAFFRKGGTDSTKTVEFAELEEGTEVQFLRELDDGAGGKSWFYQRGKVSVEADVSIADGADFQNGRRVHGIEQEILGRPCLMKLKDLLKRPEVVPTEIEGLYFRERTFGELMESSAGKKESTAKPTWTR